MWECVHLHSNTRNVLMDKKCALKVKFSETSSGIISNVFQQSSDFTADVCECVSLTVCLWVASSSSSSLDLCSVKINLRKCLVNWTHGHFLSESDRYLSFCVFSELEVEPDYYRLVDNGTTACLATGFTRQDGTYNHELFKDLINKTAAVRIEDDKVYNQVVVLPTGNNGDRCETGNNTI